MEDQLTPEEYTQVRQEVIDIITETLYKSLENRHRVSLKHCRLAAVDVFEALDAAMNEE